MQNKGVIKLLAVVLAVFSLYQLSFSYVTRRVEKKAAEYATSTEAVKMAEVLAKGDQNAYDYLLDSIQGARETYYLDSMSTVKVYPIFGQTYRQAKEMEINLGLDLKGGMNVMMEVSVPDIINVLSGHSTDPTFVEALRIANEQHLNSQRDYVDLFGDAFQQLDPNAKLAPIFLFEFKDKGITVNSTNAEVLDVIKEETNSAIDRSYQILRTRIDRFGVAQPNIQKLENSGRILVELPGIKDPKRVRKLLQGTAQLEFWETYNFTELYTYFDEANARLAEINKANEGLTEDKKEETKSDDEPALLANDSLKAQEEALEEMRSNFPIYNYLTPSYFQNEMGQTYPAQTARVGMALVKDTANINRMLKQVKNVFPRNVKFAWCVKPNVDATTGAEYIDLVALKTSRENTAALGGEVIVDARQDYDQNGRVEVTIQMNSEGAKAWKRLTGENIGRQVAIVLDDYVYSYPVVNDEIPSGRSSISGGDMTVEEAQDLANILKAGKLPAPARILEENVVGPSLGQEAINSGLWSFIIAFVLVLIYMLFFYSKAGFAADTALLVNIFFMFGVLASFGTVLTLPGIAGIVLTLGMAVDSNVIIFERIKEELRAGKGLRTAIADGYKAAYSAILDGNITTFLTAFVLFQFGTGPVQGFATTLMIGIATSLFTSLFITRLVFEGWLKKDKNINFSNNATRNFLKNTSFDFIKFGKTAAIIAGVFIVISVGSLAVRGLNLGIDFKGGRNYVVRFDKDVTVNEVRNALAEVEEFENVPEVKTYGPSRQVKITTDYKINDNHPEVDQEIQGLIYDALKGLYNTEMTYEQFTTDSDKSNVLLGILSSQKVGATVADDVTRKAFIAVIISLVVMFVYIAIRFRRWQYGVSSIVCLAHDTLLVIGMYSLFNNILPFTMEVNQSFIAAVLTIIGYSINNTVVIFDRVRENVNLFPKKGWKERFNSANNSTLLRTINTSGTTIVVLLAIFIFGGETIRGFVFALLVGMIAGTFSSLFIASPLAYALFKGKQYDEQLEQVADKKRK
ncbi:MAG: protein translocase subunit SecDF [Lentimicrobiaceae bacterium]|nr:protein translocase subunit SecDF [Lentimicrobiaceae bacterium]